MGDLGVDSTLDVYIDGSGDLAYVTGREAFNQAVIVGLRAFYDDIIGENNPDTVLELLKVGARRIARRHDEIENIVTFSAEFSDDEPDTVVVTIVYDSGEPLTFDIS